MKNIKNTQWEKIKTDRWIKRQEQIYIWIELNSVNDDTSFSTLADYVWPIPMPMRVTYTGFGCLYSWFHGECVVTEGTNYHCRAPIQYSHTWVSRVSMVSCMWYLFPDTVHVYLQYSCLFAYIIIYCGLQKLRYTGLLYLWIYGF